MFFFCLLYVRLNMYKSQDSTRRTNNTSVKNVIFVKRHRVVAERRGNSGITRDKYVLCGWHFSRRTARHGRLTEIVYLWRSRRSRYRRRRRRRVSYKPVCPHKRVLLRRWVAGGGGPSKLAFLLFFILPSHRHDDDTGNARTHTSYAIYVYLHRYRKRTKRAIQVIHGMEREGNRKTEKKKERISAETAV